MALKFRNPLIRQAAPKQAPPPEPKPEPATAVAEAAPSAVQAAAENLKVRSTEESFKVSAPGTEPGARTEPSTPGQQSNDSGVKTGPEVVNDARDRRAAPGSDSSTAELDAAANDAFAKIADARPDLRMPTDVFEAAAGTESTPVEAGEAARARLDQERPDLFGSGTDGGQEHAAEVVDQLLSGGVGQFGNRMAGLEQEIAISEGLISDLNTVATSPSVEKGDGVDANSPLGRAMREVYGEKPADPNAGKSTDVSPINTGKLGEKYYWDNKTGEVVEASHVHEGVKDQAALDTTTSRDFGRSDAAKGDDGAERPNLGKLLFGGGIGEALAESDYQEEWGAVERQADEAQARKGGGVGDPGPDGEGGLPTEAEIAFRQSVRDALGVRPNIGGDIDPQEESATVGAAGPISDVVNDNDSLIGQPNENRVLGSGHSGPLPSGGDIDPLEGSAFTGPSRGGNPEDLDFGSEVLGLDAARRSTAKDEEEDEEEEEEDDDA